MGKVMEIKSCEI